MSGKPIEVVAETYAVKSERRAEWLRIRNERARPLLCAPDTGRVPGEYLDYRDDRIKVVIRAFPRAATRARLEGTLKALLAWREIQAALTALESA